MGIFGMDEEKEATNTEQVGTAEEVNTAEPIRKMPFAVWSVGDESYKLKLDTKSICSLEEKFRTNLMNVVAGDDIPALGVMLTVIQEGAKKYNHGLKFKDFQKIADKYFSEGYSQLQLYTDVIMPLLRVSGFFTQNQAEDMEESLADMRENM